MIDATQRSIVSRQQQQWGYFCEVYGQVTRDRMKGHSVETLRAMDRARESAARLAEEGWTAEAATYFAIAKLAEDCALRGRLLPDCWKDVELLCEARGCADQEVSVSLPARCSTVGG
jgi:hypothetical protein